MSTDAASHTSLVSFYYECFNARRFSDAAALFTDTAPLEFSPGEPWSGPAGYLRFAETWTSAFPDITLAIESVNRRSETVCEIYLQANGTHAGTFCFGRYRFQPTGTVAVLHLRELLDIHDGRIGSSMISVGFNELVRQLARVDYVDMIARLDRIAALRDELRAAST